MSSFDKLTSLQKIRAALHRDVRAISSETCHFLGLELTKPAVEIIAELVFKKLSVYGTDLEAFAKHAKRSTINSEDVKLLVRRNPSLVVHLNSLASTNTTSGPKRRKTGSKPQETPAKSKEDVKNKEDANKNKEATINKETEPQSAVEDVDAISEDNRRMGDKEDAFEVVNMVVDDMIDLTFD